MIKTMYAHRRKVVNDSFSTQSQILLNTLALCAEPEYFMYRHPLKILLKKKNNKTHLIPLWC